MKSRLTIFTGVLLAWAWVASPMAAQTADDALRFTERSPATGPRMMGMAGVGIAGIDDYGALQANPAGLGYFEASGFGGALSMLSASDESRYQTSGTTTLGDGDVRSTRLGNLAYVYKLPTSRGAMVLATAYNQVNTFDRNLLFGGPNAGSSVSDSFLPFQDEFEVVGSDGSFSPEFFHVIPELAYEGGAIEFLAENVGTNRPLFYQAVVPGTTIDQSGDVLEEGRMKELSLGGAWEAAQDVMVGLSANFSFGTYRFNSLYEEVDTRNENLPDDYIVVLSDGELRGFHRLAYENGFESDLTGFNIRGGISSSVLEGVRVGVTVETPTYYEISEDYFRELETVFDEGGSLSSSQNGRFEYSLQTPWRLGGGGSWERGNLFVAGDVEYVDWSQMEFGDGDGTFGDENRAIRSGLEPVWNARVGAEYRFGRLAARAGFAYQPDPRKVEIQHQGEATDRSKRYVSAGIGYRFSPQFALDVGWMQERFDDEYVPYRNVENPPVAEESLSRNRFAVGMRVTL
ncbi:MAG: outer membrane protein transport protein [Rhodothermales bacterium]